MMRIVFGTGVLAPALLLAACGHSPQTRVLTLDAAAPPSAPATGYRGPPIVVPAVHVPAAIDRVGYVSEPTAGEVKVEDFAQWAAPLGLLARDALVRDLTARLPAGLVLPPGARGSAHARVIDVTILALDLQAGASTMQVAYRPLPNGVVRQLVLMAPGAATPTAGAQALSALLGQLADRIVADLPSR